MDLNVLMQKITEAVEPDIIKCEAAKIIVPYIYLIKKATEYRYCPDKHPEILEEIKKTIDTLKIHLPNVDFSLEPETVEGSCECSKYMKNYPKVKLIRKLEKLTGLKGEKAVQFATLALQDSTTLLNFVFKKDNSIDAYTDIKKIIKKRGKDNLIDDLAALDYTEVQTWTKPLYELVQEFQDAIKSSEEYSDLLKPELNRRLKLINQLKK